MPEFDFSSYVSVILHAVLFGGLVGALVQLFRIALSPPRR